MSAVYPYQCCLPEGSNCPKGSRFLGRVWLFLHAHLGCLQEASISDSNRCTGLGLFLLSCIGCPEEVTVPDGSRCIGEELNAPPCLYWFPTTNRYPYGDRHKQAGLQVSSCPSWLPTGSQIPSGGWDEVSSRHLFLCGEELQELN